MSENGNGVFGINGKIIKHLPKYEPLADTVGRVIDDLGKRRAGPEFKTGLGVVDQGFYGLHRSHLTIVAARAGQGKTSFACNCAFNLADQGHKIAYVSLEMSREQIISKIFCAHHKIDSFRFMLGAVTELEKNKLKAFRKLCETLPFRIVDDYCFTQDELYNLIEHLKFRPDVLILDHLQHIRAMDNRRSERENLTEYLRYLKELSMRHKIAVLCLSQINREGDDAPGLKNLKGTGAAEEMADEVLILHLKRELSPFTDNAIKTVECDAIIAKNRFGPTGKFDLLFEGNTGNFMNVEKYRVNQHYEEKDEI